MSRNAKTVLMAVAFGIADGLFCGIGAAIAYVVRSFWPLLPMCILLPSTAYIQVQLLRTRIVGANKSGEAMLWLCGRDGCRKFTKSGLLMKCASRSVLLMIAIQLISQLAVFLLLIWVMK